MWSAQVLNSFVWQPSTSMPRHLSSVGSHLEFLCPNDVRKFHFFLWKHNPTLATYKLFMCLKYMNFVKVFMTGIIVVIISNLHLVPATLCCTNIVNQEEFVPNTKSFGYIISIIHDSHEVNLSWALFIYVPVVRFYINGSIWPLSWYSNNFQFASARLVTNVPITSTTSVGIDIFTIVIRHRLCFDFIIYWGKPQY